MSETGSFAVAILICGAALALAVGANALSERIRIPTPALFLIVAAAASDVVPAFGGASLPLDEHIVTVALIFILFDGGMHIGVRRFRAAAGPIVWIGIAGTAATAAAIAAAAHLLLGASWQTALLLGAALSPTDPAVVFSVLGKRDLAGRSGTILEGESGVNDPVGIALMAVLLAGVTGRQLPGGPVLGGIGDFALQMVVGAGVGCIAGLGLSALQRRIRLPSEALYPLLMLGLAAAVYGVTVLLEGSGFLAVFVAGIVVGDVRGPFVTEVRRFGSGIASLAEIVTFTVLGLAVSWRQVVRADVLVPGLVLAALLILVIRPVFVGLLSLPIRMRRGERAFVLWAGLKGAVPILLGVTALEAHVPDGQRIFAIIFVVVLVSVVVQGTLVPAFAHLFHVPMSTREPQPFAAGMRFLEEPSGFARRVVGAGSIADGATVGGLPIGDDGWVSMVSRAGAPVPLRGSTRLEAGDEVLLHCGDDGPGTVFDAAG